MKRSPGSWRPWFGFLLALGIARLIVGCATNDERISERPWNTPKSWETGLPSGMMEERR